MKLSSGDRIRFLAQNPAHPWWKLASLILEELAGFSTFSGGKRSFVRYSLGIPRGLAGALYNPIEVAQGSGEIGITTPDVSILMANEGVGPYEKIGGAELRAIATFPHDDCLVFMVDEETLDVQSLYEMRESRFSATIVTGRGRVDGRLDVLSWIVNWVMAEHGLDESTRESRGDQVIYGGPTHIGGRLVLESKANALFHEAQGQPIWSDIARSRRVTVLDLDPEVLDRCEARFHLPVRAIPGSFGIRAARGKATVDFSGWTVFVRSDFPAELAYELAGACDRIRSVMDQWEDPGSSLKVPIERMGLFNGRVPLHPGAAEYAASLA